MTRYTDEDLLTYLNGDFDEDAAQSLEQAVGEDPELEQRLMGLDPLAAMVGQAFESVPRDADIAAISIPAAEPVVAPARFGGLRLVGTVAAMLVAGVVGYVISPPGPTPEPAPIGWKLQAALYQALYVPETVAAIPADTAAVSAQLASAEAALNRALPQDSLSDLPDLELKRAQILAFKGKPLIQLAYAKSDGTPFALCIFLRGEGKPDGPVNSEVLAGLSTASWSQGEFGYMLIGGQDDAFVTDVAGLLVEQL